MLVGWVFSERTSGLRFDILKGCGWFPGYEFELDFFLKIKLAISDLTISTLTFPKVRNSIRIEFYNKLLTYKVLLTCQLFKKIQGVYLKNLNLFTKVYLQGCNSNKRLGECYS